MKKKGFTLVETIIVIAIIGVLAGIIVPSVVRYLNKNKSDFNENLVTELTSVAKEYYSENKTELPRGQIENNISQYSNILWATELQGNNYLTSEFVDADNNSCIAQSYVFVNNDGNGNYEYQTCVICDNGYISDEDNCQFSNFNSDSNSNSYNTKDSENNLDCENVKITVNNSVTRDNKKYYIKSSPYSISFSEQNGLNNIGGIRIENVSYMGYSNNFTCSTFSNTINGLSLILYGTDPSKYKKCNYDIKTEIDDKGPEIELKSDNNDNAVYDNQDTLTCTITDEQSGIYKYIIRKTGSSDSLNTLSTFKSEVETNKTVSENGTYECVAVDNLNNESSKTITVNNIVKAPSTPTITASDSKASGSWHNADFDLTPSGSEIPSNTAGSVKYYYSINDTNWYEISSKVNVSTETTNTTYKIKACNSLKTSLCSDSVSYIVKLDKTKPTLTLKNSSGGEKTTSSVTISLSGYDAGSGIALAKTSFLYYYAADTSKKYTGNNWGKVPTQGSSSGYVNHSGTWSAVRNDTVYFQVIDQAGNYSDPVSTKIYIVSALPRPSSGLFCDIRGNTKVTDTGTWTCTAGHSHTNSGYLIYCIDSDGYVASVRLWRYWGYSIDASLVCPSSPYTSDDDWYVISDSGTFYGYDGYSPTVVDAP